MNKNIKHQEQGAILQILVVVILVIGIIFTVAVATNPTLKSFIFKSRAADNPPITFKDASGNSLPQEGGLPVTTDRTVKIELEAPAAP